MDLKGNPVGYISGWVSPDTMLGDRMEVRKYTRWSKSDMNDINDSEVGLLMAYATCMLAQDNGRNKVQFLAIFDSELQHKSLVRYYRFMGCKKVRVVGEDQIADIPLRLLYGGVGTLMEGEASTSLRRWARRFRRT
eukprot:CAMPEP_0167753574 /NCGR_PEP_ID=MMETSP0110_2-20121227/7791_1 /TAXON_ID=629695 /ORGANISM="Gymnochlora sp., Strain CCMP2014" /LENGTH=135 /DNA_ID=CAMNT_0007639359 /DNA_START=411 /DNA_END=818 /DNA_ORIENTATION=-